MTVTGTIRGRIIELADETGLPNGATVQVTIEPAEVAIESPAKRPDSRAAVLESAGAWADADGTDFDRWQKWTRDQHDAPHRDACLTDELR